MIDDEDPTELDMPFVCPGCYAVGAEPCAPWCIDAELERERRDEELYGDRSWEHGVPGDDEGEPDDGGDERLMGLALLEAELAQTKGAREREEALEPPRALGGGLLATIERLDAALGGRDDQPGARSCAGCRELVVDDFDHEFCAPDEPTERIMLGRAERGRAP